MWHEQREVRHTPAHGQPCRSGIETVAPRLQRLKAPDSEDMAKLQMKGQAARLPLAWDV